MERPGIAVYIMANRRGGTLYIGVTSNLMKRVHEHRTDAVAGFTREHDLHLLVWYEIHETMESAIHREKRLKKYRREAKLKLIESMNSQWEDLWNIFVL